MQACIFSQFTAVPVDTHLTKVVRQEKFQQPRARCFNPDQILLVAKLQLGICPGENRKQPFLLVNDSHRES
jgi:hypothetical protein